jgi:hypothetical protein
MQQSVHDGPHAEQLRAGRERCGAVVSLVARVQIGPRGRQQRPCTVREDEHEMQQSAPLHAGEDFQRLPFKRVAAPDDCHSLGITMVMVVMGSLSGGLLAASIRRSCSSWWRCGSRIGGC